MPNWTPAFPLEDLPRGGAKLLKTDTHKLALFRLEDGEVFAVDNACPHEGYPLVQGEVKGRVLTCAWHNFKFSLEDGTCLKGDEAVRHYATRTNNGTIEVDLTAEEPAVAIEKAWQSLEEAVVENQTGRMARDVVRLLHAGVPAVQVLAYGAALDARYSEYGTSHALPVATDLIEYLNGDIEHDTLVIMQLMELVSEPNQRRPRQEWPEPIAATDFENELSQAIEDEHADRAIALVRGALAQGTDPGPALLRCASEHFLGFGHALIYSTKTLELLEHDDTHKDDIFSALTLRILSSTREDTLPPMAKWRRWVDEREFKAGTTPLDHVDELAQRLLDRKDKQVEQDFAQLISTSDPQQLVDVLVEAAAQRLLNFNPAIHEDWKTQDGWLFVTHPLTYAHAIRESMQRSSNPAILKNLIWCMAFIRRSHRLDLPEAVRPQPHDPTTPGDLIAALAGHDPQIVDIAHACTGDITGPLRSWILAGQATRPIYIAHQIKTARVALQEDRADTPLLAAARFLSMPATERGIRAQVHDATQLVIHGNLPRRLSS